MSLLNLPRFVSANVSTITDRILIGGDLDMYDTVLADEQIVELVEQGVTHIVDCRIEAEDSSTWDEVPEINYLQHGMDDAGQHVPGEWFEAGVKFLREALEDPGAIVLTHCHMGINRGPSLGYALLLDQGWDPVEAIEVIRRARPIAFVSYAEDALRWHHRRTGATAGEVKAERKGLAEWRRNDTLDMGQVIRKIRQKERK